MKIIYRINGFQEAEAGQIRHRVERKLPKLERVSGRTHDEAAVLRINARKIGKPEGSRVSLSLTLRRGVLFTERTDSDSLTALDRALDSIIEEVRTFRASAYRERQRRRHGRVAEELSSAEPYLLERARLEDRESFDLRLRPLLRSLYTLSVNEVRDRQVAEELPPGAIDPVEVVDEVVARAYEAFRKDGIHQPLRTWLVGAMHTYLDEVQQTHEAEPAVASPVHLEENIPQRDDPMEVRSLGDEQLEFYHPDESLHFEDVLPDIALADPMETLSAREQMRFIHQTIRRLPRQQRQAFLLHADGFDNLEIGMIQKRREEDVGEDIRKVRELILGQLGLAK